VWEDLSPGHSLVARRDGPELGVTVTDGGCSEAVCLGMWNWCWAGGPGDHGHGGRFPALRVDFNTLVHGIGI
jgi:hypothetical protein